MGEVLTLVRDNGRRAWRSGQLSHEHQDRVHSEDETRRAAKHAVPGGVGRDRAEQVEDADAAAAGQTRPNNCEMQKWLLSVWDGAKVVLVPHMRGCAMAPYRPPLRNWNAQFSSPWHKTRPHGPRSAGSMNNNSSSSSSSSSNNNNGNVFEMHLERA